MAAIAAAMAADVAMVVAVKSVVGGSFGKIKIAATNAINVAVVVVTAVAVADAAINAETLAVMPLKNIQWVHSEYYSLCTLCLTTLLFADRVTRLAQLGGSLCLLHR